MTVLSGPAWPETDGARRVAHPATRRDARRTTRRTVQPGDRRFSRRFGRRGNLRNGRWDDGSVARRDDLRFDRWDDRRTGHWDDGRTGHWDDGRTGHWDDGRTGHWDDHRDVRHAVHPADRDRPVRGVARRAWGVLAGTVLPVLGALCLLLTGAGVLFGAEPLVVVSGSMEPAVPVGSVLVTREMDAASIRPGEVVAVRDTRGRTVLHRAKQVSAVPGGATRLVLQGDANPAADPPVTVRTVRRPLVTLPGLGGALRRLDGAWVQFGLGVLTGLTLAAGAREVGGRRRPAAMRDGPA